MASLNIWAALCIYILGTQVNVRQLPGKRPNDKLFFLKLQEYLCTILFNKLKGTFLSSFCCPETIKTIEKFVVYLLASKSIITERSMGRF